MNMAHAMYSKPGITDTRSLIPVIAVSVCTALGTNCDMAKIHPARAAPIPQPAFCANTAAEKYNPVARLPGVHSR